MKTAISLPDELFEAVERLVKRSDRSRSEVYAEALREYVARHSPDERTEAINAALAKIGDYSEEVELARAASRRVLSHVEW